MSDLLDKMHALLTETMGVCLAMKAKFEKEQERHDELLGEIRQLKAFLEKQDSSDRLVAARHAESLKEALEQGRLR